MIRPVRGNVSPARSARRRAFGQLSSVVIVVVAISVYVQFAPRRPAPPPRVAEVAADQSASANEDEADSTPERSSRPKRRRRPPRDRSHPSRLPSSTGPRSPARKGHSTRPAAIERGPTNGPPSRLAG